MKRNVVQSLSLRNLSPLYRKLHSFELDKGFSMSTHEHSFYHINLILDGSVIFSSNDTDTTINKGNVVIAPAFVSHSLQTKTGYKQIGIDLNLYDDVSGIFQLLTSSLPDGPTRIYSVPIIEYYKFELVDRFFKDFSDVNRLRAIHFMDEILLNVIIQLQGEYQNSFKTRFLELMNCENAYQFSVSEIAETLNLSKTHLERLTKKNFGCSTKEYSNKIKLSLLCQYLEHTSLTHKEICDTMNFYDESHLTTFFKKRMSCTPTEFRNESRSNFSEKVNE